jgi:hypothetical protein
MSDSPLNEYTLKEQLELLIFADKPEYSNATMTVSPISHLKLGDGAEIKISQMYENWDVNFAMLKKISNLLQTDQVDVNNWCDNSGCETCGYYSKYLTAVQVYGGRAPELLS